MAKDEIIFTDLDLDGSCSYLIHVWLTGKKQKVVTLKVSDLRERFLQWLTSNKIESYKRVYFYDLDTTEIKDLIDKDNVYIFDHHKTHNAEYKNATAIIEKDCPSCSKLLYKHYKDKLQNFIDDFEHGFHGFTTEQNKIISFHFYKYKKVVKDLNLFETNLNIASKEYRFVSAFVSEYVNDVGQHIIDTTNCDVCIMINLKNNRVYLRKNKNCDLDLGKFAKKVCDGGGHEYAAGGNLNDNVLALSKQFVPING